MGPTDNHLGRENFSDIRQDIIALQGDIMALSRDTENRLETVLSELLNKRKDNLILEKAFYLEQAKRKEKAELDSLNKLHRLRLQHQRILTETTAEAFNRQAKIETAHEIKRAEALKSHAEAITAIQEAQFKRTEQVESLLLSHFDSLTTTTASKITEMQAILGRSNPTIKFEIEETREKLDADGKVVTELKTVQVDEVVKKYFTDSGTEFVLAAGQAIDELGYVIDEATKNRIKKDGKEIQLSVQEVLQKVDKQIEVAVMETSKQIIDATTLATEAIKKRFIDMRIGLAETEAQLYERQIMHNDIMLEANWHYLNEQKRINDQRIAAAEEVDRRLLALGINYNDEKGRGHGNDFLSGTKENLTAFKDMMVLEVFGKDSKLIDRFKGLGLAIGALFNSENLWSVENNVMTRMALDNQKKAADYFAETILGSGKTLGERLEGLARMFSRKDAFGKVHTIEGDKKAFDNALAVLKIANAEKPEEERLTYKVKQGGREVEKTATTDKEILKALNQRLKEAKKSGKWQNVQQARMELEKAKNDPSKAEDVDALQAAFEAALKEANMDESMAIAADAQEQQKATTQAGWANATAMLASISAKLDGLIDDIAKNQSVIDTRLAGSEQNSKMMGSYWRQISFDMSATMMSPLIREQTLIDNIMAAVDKGIARDVQQMGMLETMKDKIATTFDVFDGTMLRLIRIQDKNTTAARLGMEASLNSFLNQMYESTEYLNSLASSVRGSLEEAQALMGAEDAVDFEYQVQKWLGSLSSVGVSDQGVMAIADAIGKLASGDVEGITNGGAGNLVVMAANNANISLADVLADGLDASETNVLLNQMVGYMYDLTVEANGNLVVQQQLAKVFGLAASDLKAATNLIYEYNDKSGQMKTIYNKGTGDTYNQMLSELFAGANQMYARTSLGEMLTNVWENVQYSTAAGMANNPALYLLTKSANILDEFAGGIPIPAITAFGTGVDTKLTVSNIMKTAAMVGGFTQSLVSMIASSIGNGGGGLTGSGLLKLVGVQSKVSRGASTSSSGKATVYNASVEDTTESATQSGKDSAKQETASAKEESSEVTNETLNESVLSIYKLLDGVINGNSTLRVHVAEPATIPVKVENISEFASAWTP